MHGLKLWLFVCLAYAQGLERLLSEKMEFISQFREKVAAFRAQLLAEERISQQMKHAPRHWEPLGTESPASDTAAQPCFQDSSELTTESVWAPCR